MMNIDDFPFDECLSDAVVTDIPKFIRKVAFYVYQNDRRRDDGMFLMVKVLDQYAKLGVIYDGEFQVERFLISGHEGSVLSVRWVSINRADSYDFFIKDAIIEIR